MHLCGMSLRRKSFPRSPQNISPPIGINVLALVKPATINRELGIISHAIKIAPKRLGRTAGYQIRITLNIQRPSPLDRSRDRRLSLHEHERLLQALMDNAVKPLLARGVVRFAIATGLRRGEILNARWRDLNWDLGTLHIPETKTVPRTIPLSFRSQTSPGRTGSDSLAGTGADFPDYGGGGEAGLEAADQESPTAEPSFPRSQARSHKPVLLAERGLSIPEVALISGHKDPRMLFRYTHLKAEDVARKLSGPV